MQALLSSILKTQATASDVLPSFRYHITDEIVNFEENYVMCTFRFTGIPFEAISDNYLKNHHDNLNQLFANATKQTGGRLGMWSYLKRRKLEFNQEYNFNSLFMKKFSQKYLQRFNDKDYFENTFYLTLTLKFETSLDDAILELQDVMDLFRKSMIAYEPRALRAYKKNGVYFSEIAEFYYELLNLEKPISSFPITQTPMCEALQSSSLHFHYETLEARGHQSTNYASFYDLKDFPSVTKNGMFNAAMLALPFEFTLVQSFVGMTSAKAMKMIEDRLNQLASVDDKAEHQMEEMVLAQGFVSSGELALGDYSASLIVYGNNNKQALTNGTSAVASFANNGGAIFTKATASAAATFFTQFPTYKTRPRHLIKSTRNLSATFCLHNYSQGKRTGNPFGDGSALMPIETLAKSVYHLNFHYSNKDENALGKPVAGHTLVLGATGSGKTTTQSAILGFAERFKPRYFVLDKERGSEMFVRGLGGDYFTLTAGEDTGINPFQFEDTPQLREFLYDLVSQCGRNSQGLITAEEENQCKHAVDTVFLVPVEDRRMSRILENIPHEGGDSLYARLSKWCHASDGRFAWVLDSETNRFDPSSFTNVGFDLTDILKPNLQTTAPLLACLLYMKSLMQKKIGLLFTVVEEFWLALLYKITRDQIYEILKVGRRRFETLVLVSQSPDECFKSEIFAAIVEQTATKILLPNPDAEYGNDNGKGGYKSIGLSEKEFDQFSKLGQHSRTFLIKQGNQSAFGKIDLVGFDHTMPILSTDENGVALADSIVSQLKKHTGKDKIEPDLWLPHFWKALDKRAEQKRKEMLVGVE